MPAALVKGIICSITIITVLGATLLENPHVQEWIEEQRRKVAEWLPQILQELDPESRRAAEAFAYEGRTVINDDGLRREASRSQEAAALATGRSLSNPGTIRRIPVRGPTDPNEAEERRRKGREYLARRNQQMYELQQRRSGAKAVDPKTHGSTTFDSLVDSEGKLKSAAGFEKELPSPPVAQLLPEPIEEEMHEVDRCLPEPPLAGESSLSAASGWQAGSCFANPFGDEYALERSITPKPPAVPPKIELDRTPSPSPAVHDRAPSPPISVPGAFISSSRECRPAQEQVDHSELSYEEQLAIALSLSEQESSISSATVRQSQPVDDDENLRAAIAASLNDMDHEQAAHAVSHAELTASEQVSAAAHPLVDLSPSTPSMNPRRSSWEALFDPHNAPSHEILSLAPSAAPSEASDELYRLTPELTRARLAHFDAQQCSIAPSSAASSLPYDPVRDAAGSASQPVQDLIDASFYSAPDVVSSPNSTSTRTMDHQTPQLIDVTEDVLPEGARTPTSRAQSSFGFQTDSDTETWASASAPRSRTQSRARSEASTIEVIDLAEDSDIDMLSEEGDGIATPDSWSEVGSRDGESDVQENTRLQS